MRLNLDIVKKCIVKALEEDHVEDDITTKSLFPDKKNIEAKIIALQQGIICGLPIIDETFNLLSNSVSINSEFKDGNEIKKNDIVAELNGPCQILLSAERVILNFLSHLSGIAALTSKFVKLANPYNVKIMDTRKTLPGLRHLQKYAVYVGGGYNHRMDLKQMFLLKDNHIELLLKNSPKKNIYKEAIIGLRKKYPLKKIEVEVENLDNFKKILSFHPDIIMLDNMNPKDIKKAIRIKQELSNHDKKIKVIQIEASGGINLHNITKYLTTGVDRISIGALTNSAPRLDFSMEIK